MSRATASASRVALALFFSASCSIALAAFLHGHDRIAEGEISDARVYLEMARRGGSAEVAAPYRYRVLVPWIAARLPLPAIDGLDAEGELVLRFALLNLLGLTAAAWGLFHWLVRFGFEPLTALLGGCLYLGSFHPLFGWTSPSTDAWAQALLVAALLALADRRWTAVGLLFALAVFQKESILLLPAMALFLGLRRDELARLGLALVPGLAGYVWLRRVALPADEPAHWLASMRGLAAGAFGGGLETLAFGVFAAAAFGVLWILAALGWAPAGRDPVLRRLRWFVPAFLPAPFVLVVNPAKTWFYAFPVVLPLALAGLRRVLGDGRPADGADGPPPPPR